jgi:alpha-galactosidase
MMAMAPNLSSPKAIAELGEKIYAERYKEQYERDYPGKFVAIDVKRGAAYVEDAPEAALERASSADPSGLFHLIRIGFSGAFQISYAFPQPDLDWLSQ